MRKRRQGIAAHGRDGDACECASGGGLFELGPCTGIGGENAEGVSFAGEHFVALVYCDILVCVDFYAEARGHCGDFDFRRAACGVRVAVEVDRIRAGFAHELLQHACCAPFADDEPAALGFEISMQ